ncbi:GNAT family N-acetyltransferase [Planomicrobium soli]
MVGVHSNGRGKGVGRALFLHVIDWAKRDSLLVDGKYIDE